MSALCADPVSGDVLDDPVLASDGETYSRESLCAAMAADVWKRSPVTGEVLRHLAYVTVFVRRVLGDGSSTIQPTGVQPQPTPVQLYDPKIHEAPPTGRRVSWALPLCLSPADTLVRRRFGIADAPFTVTATLFRDGSGNDWLMHPPAVHEMRDDVLALAKLLGATRLVCNPWCLTWAVLDTGETVESRWIISHSASMS